MVTIEEQPAGEVYRDWVDSELSEGYLPDAIDALDTEAMKSHMVSVLSKSTLCPLGCRVNDTGDDCRDYILYHPSALLRPTVTETLADGFLSPQPAGPEINIFCNTSTQHEVVLMRARSGDLLTRVVAVRSCH